jgi:thiol:disulfide interchange protein
VRAAALAVCAAMLACVAAGAQKLPWQTADTQPGMSAQLVHFLYPQQVTVKAGRTATIELHFRIQQGLHINSHTPPAKSLIGTELKIGEAPGVTVSAVEYPTGVTYAFPAFPSEKLSVYTGEFVVKVHLTSKPGNHLLQASLRYQACDTNSCFPPRNTAVPIDIVAQ